jgi:hypothetical protein
MVKIDLKDITIVSVTGINSKSHLGAIKYSSKHINFGQSKLITTEDIEDKEVEIIKIDHMDYEEYSRFLVYELGDFIDTTHALIVQSDGYVVNPNKWNNLFLDFDYIGAPWPLPQDNFSYRDPKGNLCRVGNGGFSLRSKKLLKLAKELNLKWKDYFGFYNEDGFYCCHNRESYENNGCKFAPIEVASIFSQENIVEENKNLIPFGFHGKNNPYYKKTKQDLLRF